MFEVKRPAASRSECIGALEQGVRYAAALDYVMNRNGHRAAYWQLFGSRRGERHAPAFSVIAVLDEAGGTRYKRDLGDKIKQLNSSNSRNYDLRLMLYRRAGNRIGVVSV